VSEVRRNAAEEKKNGKARANQRATRSKMPQAIPSEMARVISSEMPQVIPSEMARLDQSEAARAIR
jgi:hypothetical protein